MNKYVSVKLDEADKSLIHYMKTKVHKGGELKKKKSFFVTQEEATKPYLLVGSSTVLSKRVLLTKSWPC